MRGCSPSVYRRKYIGDKMSLSHKTPMSEQGKTNRRGHTVVSVAGHPGGNRELSTARNRSNLPESVRPHCGTKGCVVRRPSVSQKSVRRRASGAAGIKAMGCDGSPEGRPRQSPAVPSTSRHLPSSQKPGAHSTHGVSGIVKGRGITGIVQARTSYYISGGWFR